MAEAALKAPSVGRRPLGTGAHGVAADSNVGDDDVPGLRRRLAEAEAMVRVLHNDALVLGEKLGDATERRAEIQATNDLIARELDVLTEKLFEEANHLVSAESRRRYVLRPRSPAVDVAVHMHSCT